MVVIQLGFKARDLAISTAEYSPASITTTPMVLYFVHNTSRPFQPMTLSINRQVTSESGMGARSGGGCKVCSHLIRIIRIHDGSPRCHTRHVDTIAVCTPDKPREFHQAARLLLPRRAVFFPQKPGSTCLTVRHEIDPNHRLRVAQRARWRADPNMADCTRVLNLSLTDHNQSPPVPAYPGFPE